MATAYDIKDMTGRTPRVLVLLVLALLTARAANAQRVRGELRIEVRDQQGAPVPTQAELVSEGNQFRQTFQVGADGRYVLQDLAFGVYRLSVSTEGFAPWSG
ncbi:MAG TPA: carboxypeptidase-like regulatory domain-containing protein, partial [Candidatus Acidoferrum sp.]